MKAKRFFSTGIFLALLFLASGFSFAKQAKYTGKYAVTITNATRGQIFSPPLVIGHNRGFRLFELGVEAGEELAALAEDGDPSLLTALIDTNYPDIHYAVAGGVVLPGHSITVEITLDRYTRLISVAGMLVTSNDAFFAVRDVWIPFKGKVVLEAEAYDAGSERNSEDCNFIPGPPCDSPFKRDAEDAEGYVHIHAGIHGGANSNLIPAEHDWRNPVAQIKIRRIY